MVSVIDNSRTKKKCQIFTPSDKVSDMLDIAGYKTNLYGKRVLENSCGDGNFLLQIVERYVSDARKNNYSDDQIRTGLKRDIWAFDVDKSLVTECKRKLSQVLESNGLEPIEWNIICADFLEQRNLGFFDYIIGNPPYIAYPDLPEEVQKFIKTNYVTCKKGKFDYSYAFVEKSYSLLAANGCLVYIIPSNIFKNVFAAAVRKLIIDDLELIVEFPNERVFENALVSPAIVRVVKGSNSQSFGYSETSDDLSAAKSIMKRTLADRWFFDLESNNQGTRVGDHYKASNTIATLLNKVFVLKAGSIKGDYYCIDDNRIEMRIIRKATSPKHKRYGKKSEYIIFPYHFDGNGNQISYEEADIQKEYPGAMSYLLRHKESLDKRDADKTAKWFEYGRSQAICNMNQPKLLISTIISECTEAYLLPEDEIPYSGIYIVPTGEKGLAELLTELNSQRFRDYISKVGVSVSGTSKRITTKDIEDYIY